MHFTEKDFPKEFIKKFQSKSGGKISSLCTDNRNINFCTIWPLA